MGKALDHGLGQGPMPWARLWPRPRPCPWRRVLAKALARALAKAKALGNALGHPKRAWSLLRNAVISWTAADEKLQ